MDLSIIISTRDRLSLWRRTLWGIAHRLPPGEFEVVVCDDGSDEDVLGELRSFSPCFPWTFIRFDETAFAAATGLRKFLNNPAASNNIAARHARGAVLIQQGNEVIPTEGCYARLLADAPHGADPTKPWLAFTTTYDVPPEVLRDLDDRGENLSISHVERCLHLPLQSEHYRSDVTNYISAAPASLWDALGGYDERYHAGISAEDSDFVRRARKLPGFAECLSPAVSLHQSHGGKTRFYDPPITTITPERWREGCEINHAIYHSWGGSVRSGQKWPWGTLGVGETITNWK